MKKLLLLFLTLFSTTAYCSEQVYVYCGALDGQSWYKPKVKYSYGDFLPSSGSTFDLYIAFGTWQTLEKGELQIPYFLINKAQYDQFTSICSDGYVPHPASDFWDTSWYLFAIKDEQERLKFMPGHFSIRLKPPVEISVRM
ncbi:hypothetical protein NMR53_003525 [Vibrio cholerae]|uniref:hypothetical protein n=1 Tax=Vibrio cholerae TaxID=666 RepID=UPI000E0CE512|nr:hypothetical protein [Vibrio cholerae]EGQ7642053.1 hypothetical protein [Vibrio cholerae]EJL6357565.1 hypothetical protein [Vibrio cholerae]HCJ7274150.1 hypothetical protein [Vibrio cholerae]HCJ7281409.1 hypothetical protein [Vibrio cholerae]HCJ7319155.1 hypothetical protein [Vibrio cholerae]